MSRGSASRGEGKMEAEPPNDLRYQALPGNE